jgi:hypothetical protein
MTTGIRDGLALICLALIGFLLAAITTVEWLASAAEVIGFLLGVVGLGVLAFSLARKQKQDA